MVAECEPIAVPVLSGELRDQVIEAICAPDWHADYVTRAIEIVQDVLGVDEHGAMQIVIGLYKDGAIELRPRRDADSPECSDTMVCEAKWFRVINN
jgi:hypothetical protein